MVDLNLIQNIEIKNLIDNKVGCILEESETGILIKEKLGGDCHLNNTNINEGIEWLNKHIDDVNFICVYQKDYHDYLILNHGYKEFLTVKPVAYLKKEYPEVNDKYSLRKATDEDFELIISNYHNYSEDDIKELISLEKIFLMEDNGETVGMIGEHFAGSMGLLLVFDKYRKKGYGTILEKLNIIRILKKGNIPCGQVEVNNEKSFKLQKKLGLTVSDEIVYWVFKE